MRRKHRLTFAIASIALTLLAACGGAPAAPATAPSAPPTSPPATATTVVTATSAVTATTVATTAATATMEETNAPTATGAAVATTAPTSTATGGGPTGGVPQSSLPNCGKPNCAQPGPAITQSLWQKGNAANGAQIYAANCKKCHGDQGKGGINNPGSTDGTIPALNPVDADTFNTKDRSLFATELDLFIEHGSTPDGPSPVNVMDAWGDKGKVSPQQIVDVIAYLMSLNP